MSKVKITGNASGTGVFTIEAPGTNDPRTLTLPDATGTLLNSDGDGSSLTGVGGAWTLIGTSEASASASLTVTGLDSTYDAFAIVCTDLNPATDAAVLELQIGDSSGVDVGGSDYRFHGQHQYDGATSYGAIASAGADHIQIGTSTGNEAEGSAAAILYLLTGSDGTGNPLITGNWICNDASTTDLIQGGMVIGTRVAVITVDRIRIQFSTGNIDTGRLSVYGIAHA